MKKHFGVLLLILLFLLLVLRKVSVESKKPVLNQQAEKHDLEVSSNRK